LQISAEDTCTKPLYDYINFKFSKIGQGNKYLKKELMKNMEQQKRKQMDRQNQYIQSKTNKNRKNILKFKPTKNECKNNSKIKARKSNQIQSVSAIRFACVLQLQT